MEDRDEKTGSEPEIEAHRRRTLKANEEVSTEDQGDDVEAHRRKAAKANDEPGDASTDDVELHRRKATK